MKVALWQTEPVHDADRALAGLAEACSHAAAEGAEIVVTPEMALGGYNIGPDAIRGLAERSAWLIAEVAGIAQRHGIAIAAGMAFAGPDKPFNGVVVVDCTGRERGRYHKTHLFGEVDARQFAPGVALSVPFEMNGWKIGLAICYDIEFPEVARAIALQGAELILVPTANMLPYDTVATRMVPTRAEENGVFLAYANYVGTEEPFTYCGLSCVCGPNGNDLARAGASSSGLIIADLNRTALARHRHLDDRRGDLYGTPNKSLPR